MNIGAYIRVSTEEQATEGFSIANQKESLLHYCKSKGWNLYNYYIDDGYTGKNLNRPAFTKMMSDIDNGLVHGVLVYKTDRLSRRVADIAAISDSLKEKSCFLHSVSEPFDTSTHAGELFLNMLASFAQYERDEIIQKAKTGMRQRAKEGYWKGGPVTFGYTYQKGNKILEVDPSDSLIVTEIFTLFLQGNGIERISTYMNEVKKLASPWGGKWCNKTVGYILRNKTYCGYIKSNDDWFKAKHESIISEEEWKVVQEQYDRRIESSGGSRRSEYLLTGGLTSCGICGSNIRGIKQNRKGKEPDFYYVCDKQSRHTECDLGYHKMDYLNDYVIKHLNQFHLNEKKIHQWLHENQNHLKSTISNYIKAKDQLEKKLKLVDRKLAKWYTAFENDLLSPVELRERMNHLKIEKEQVLRQIDEINEHISNKENSSSSFHQVVELLKKFPIIFDKATFREKKTLLRLLINSVVIHKDGTIDIALYKG